MGRLITLLTDFGTRDGFVGAIKGVLLSIAPDSQVVDLTHDIAAQDVSGGAWALREAAPLFPRGTIHVVVVDPGVGTVRRPLLLAAGGQLFVGPDNGVLTLAAPSPSGAWCLDRAALHRPCVSSTFHGRDIFAPVAAHLAAGHPPGDVGSPLSSWERLEPASARRVGDQIIGHVDHVDHFGNLISSIDAALLGGSRRWDVRVGSAPAGPLRSTFGDVSPGEWVAYVGSGGRVEVAVREGSAAQRVRDRRSAIVLSKRKQRAP